MSDIPHLLKSVECTIEKIVKADGNWQKCYPCHNGGICCFGADVLASHEELEIIHEYLKGKPDVIALTLKKIRNSQKCIFFDPSYEQCPIFEVRPIICRITPMKCHVKDGVLEAYKFIPGLPCNNMNSLRLPVSSVDGRVVSSGERYFFMVNDIYKGFTAESVTDFFRKRLSTFS